MRMMNPRRATYGMIPARAVAPSGNPTVAPRYSPLPDPGVEYASMTGATVIPSPDANEAVLESQLLRRRFDERARKRDWLRAQLAGLLPPDDLSMREAVYARA